LINQGYLGRKESIDLLEGLDFDFLNGFREDQEDGQGGFEQFEFNWNDMHGKGNGQSTVPPVPSYSGPSLSNPQNITSSMEHSNLPPPPFGFSVNSSVQAASNAHFPYKDRTFSEVALDSMEKRKESFDALMISDMIFDDVAAGVHANLTNINQENPDLSLFEDAFFDYSQEKRENNSPHQRRSIRFDSLTDNLLNPDLTTSNVELSAYAAYAQTLQNNKSKTSKGIPIPPTDSSKLVNSLLRLVLTFSLANSIRILSSSWKITPLP
jgi:hypothetical protein